MFAAVAALALAGAQAASPQSSFTDPSGDAGGAPDITAVSVDTDPFGAIQFTITTAQPRAEDGYLLVGIDADANPGTGGPYGVDYIVEYLQGAYAFAKWNGTSYVDAPASTVLVSFDGNVSRIEINQSDLDGTDHINFLVSGQQIVNGTVVSQDYAPDTGTWPYTVAAAPLPPTVALDAPLARAPGIHAGKRFSVVAPVETDADAVTVACAARVGARALRVRAVYANGRAVCTGLVPRGTAGKKLVGRFTASITNDQAGTSFTFVILR